MRPLSRLLPDEGGNSLVEFALFSPILVAMLMGLTDVAMGYKHKLDIEQSAYRSLERVQVNFPQASYAFLQAEAATAAGVPASQVSVDHWRECDRVVQASVAGTCSSGQDSATYVRVTINSSYTPFFADGVLPLVNGGVPITAVASTRVQ